LRFRLFAASKSGREKLLQFFAIGPVLGEEFANAEVRKDLAGDELVSSAPVIDADHSGEYGDGFLLGLRGSVPFQRHAHECVGRPHLLPAEIQTAGADVGDLVGCGCATSPVERDEAGQRDALASAAVPAERD
jgi:hypothetical protein